MLKYRKELDGLRALAVLFVIFYHSSFSVFDRAVFKGGLFGVDIFFVLSGYLITGIIKKSMDDDNFSFIDFYLRRAKRIIPVLLFILLTTSMAAYLILLPDNLISYANSLKSALSFWSNIFFFNEDSYVSVSSIYKPLLHTWSLAVEWQFYMVYPIIFWVCHKLFRKYTFLIMLFLALFSLQLSDNLVREDPDFSFFMLPTRMWELLFGGLLAFINRDSIVNCTNENIKIFYSLMSSLGLFLIFYSVIFFNDKYLHPSFITTIPVIGACLYILFARNGDLLTNILSSKPFVFIGVISYSLYLWHQPVFVFFRLLNGEVISKVQFIFLILISIILSWITYKIIETPFRKNKLSKLKCLIIFSMFIASSLFYIEVIKNKGFPDKLNGLVRTTYDMYKEVEFRRLSSNNAGHGYKSPDNFNQCGFRTTPTACRFGDESWVVVGDSYAGTLSYSLNEELQKNGRGIIAFDYEQCPFVTDVWFGNVPECVIINKERWDEIEKFNEQKNFVVTANYNQFYGPKIATKDPISDAKKDFQGGEPAEPSAAWDSYVKNINKLLSMGHKVYVVYAIPEPGFDVKASVFSQLRNKNSKLQLTYSTDKDSYKNATAINDKLDSLLPDNKSLVKIKPTDIFCNSSGACVAIGEDGGYYNLGGHLSYIGSQKINKVILSK